MRRFNKLPSFANVAVGQTATLNLPVGLTYDVIKIAYGGGVTLAQLKNIRVMVNGKEIQRFSDGNQLDEINQYYGRGAAANGYLNLWFVRPEMLTLEDQRVTALGTADVQTATVYVDIDSAATGVSLTATAAQSYAAKLGLITKVKQFPVTFATSGLQEIDKLPLGGAHIIAMHLIKADVSHVEVDVNSINIYDLDKTIGEDVQSDYGRTPQTAEMTTVDFVLEGVMHDSLVTAGVQDFRVKPTITTSGAVLVVVEYLDGFAGI